MKSVIDRNIIFVGGIHGVGKTTLCKMISEELFLKHYSSSELISNLKNENLDKNKKVSNVIENQNILLESINKYFDNSQYNLLDGHFCLLDSAGNITKVPLETFESLRLKFIIILVDEEEEILKRLVNRDTRYYSLDFIKEFQHKEVHYAQEIAEHLKVSFKIINARFEKGKMLDYISKVL